jgi:hypothetical protein
MSDYRSEASSRSAVKTELTSAHLECLLISLQKGRHLRMLSSEAVRTAKAVTEGAPETIHLPTQFVSMALVFY